MRKGRFYRRQASFVQAKRPAGGALLCSPGAVKGFLPGSFALDLVSQAGEKPHARAIGAYSGAVPITDPHVEGHLVMGDLNMVAVTGAENIAPSSGSSPG